MTYTRQAKWEYVAMAPLVDHVFSRTELPRLEARKTYERSRLHAKVHGGAGKLVRNGVTRERFSYVAENE